MYKSKFWKTTGPQSKPWRALSPEDCRAGFVESVNGTAFNAAS